MDINSISNNLSLLGGAISNSNIQKSFASGEIRQSDDFLSLSIRDYNQKRDELSIYLQASNEGIGISKTAVNGIERQDDILKNMKDILIKTKDNELFENDKNQIKNELNQNLLKFREEAFQTKYKNENLLFIGEYEDKKSIDVFTKNEFFSMEKPDTPKIATNIANTIRDVDLNNPEQFDGVIDFIENSRDELKNIQDKFVNFEKNLENNVRESIKEQVDLLKLQKSNTDINFAKEAKDFSKTNIQANMGYLLASQANIVQEQSVRLLS